MTLPINSASAESFVVIVTTQRNENESRETFVFKSSTSLKEIFDTIFSVARTEFSSPLPRSVEILPNLSSLPPEKSILEKFMDQEASKKSTLDEEVPF